MPTMDFSERDVKGRQQAKRTRTILYLAAALFIVAIIVLIIIICLELLVFKKSCMPEQKMKIAKKEFGRTASGTTVYKFTMSNEKGIEVDFITLGGILTAIRVPYKTSGTTDVILGLDNLSDYEKDHPYYGALVGRYANRIANGTFQLDGVQYKLTINNGPNSLHGGTKGWSMKVWEYEERPDAVVLSLTSPDNDEGYPGEVKAMVTYRLTEDNELIIDFQAETKDKATPINLTSHPYFNLAGQGTGTIYDHKVFIYADSYLEVSDTLIPTGKKPVVNTRFDFREGVVLASRMVNVTDGDFDHNFCVRGPTGRKLVARVEHPPSGRVLEVYTNQPGLQFYTGNFLNDNAGKGGTSYGKHHAFCMEPQNYPDAPNKPDFPDSILRPGSTYIHNMSYKFSTM